MIWYENMTPEEISFQENFLYPLFLLLIGGGLSVGLIQLFNFVHEIKLRKIEVQREEAQKRIDREREDTRFSYEIKERLLEKDSERYTWFGKTFKELIEECNKEKKDQSKIDELYKNALYGLTFRNVPIANLIALYIEDMKVTKANQKYFEMMNDAFRIALTEPNSKTRRDLLNEYLKEFDLTLNEDEINDAVACKSGSFEPMLLIASESGKVTGKILAAKIHFHSIKT